MCEYNKTSHLEMVASVIDRHNRNCFQIKSGVITIISALLAIYADKGRIEYIYICVFPLVCGYVMESIYLKNERCYRDLYEDVRNNALTNYEMNIENYKKHHNFIESARSPSIFLMYFIIFIILLFLWA